MRSQLSSLRPRTSLHSIRFFAQCRDNSPTNREGSSAPLEQHRLPRESVMRGIGGGGGGGGGGSSVGDGAVSATSHQPPRTPPAPPEPLLRRIVLDVGRGRCRITNGTREVRLVTPGSNFSEAAIELSTKEQQWQKQQQQQQIPKAGAVRDRQQGRDYLPQLQPQATLGNFENSNPSVSPSYGSVHTAGPYLTAILT